MEELTFIYVASEPKQDGVWNTEPFRRFMASITEGRLDDVVQCLDHHPEWIDEPDEDDMYPLHRAAFCDFGWYDQPDEDEMDPLRRATWNARKSILERVLHRTRPDSISLCAPDRFGFVPLHRPKRSDTLELMLRFTTASLDTLNKFEETPLFMVLRDQKRPQVIILKAAGASTVPNRAMLNYARDPLLHEPMDEEEILEIRFRIYFRYSFLSDLLFLI